jgi:5-methyltetrahydropteroyltriglutamate--homocysteine methyltransferase
MIGSSVSGNLPRPQELIAKTRAYDRAKLSDEELETAYREATKQVIEWQMSAGLTHINDGLLKWQDLLRPFTEGLKGIEIGPMARWFNNNTFYKVPVVKAKINYDKPLTEKLIYRNLLPKEKMLKAVLPAPYTLTTLSMDYYYKDKEKLQTAYAEALNQEALHLEKLGFKYIQFNDPALVYITTQPQSQELKAISKSLEVVTAGLKAKTCLQTFFGDIKLALPEILDFPVTELGVDLYETNTNVLKGLKFNEGLSLGLVDARNSIIEDPNDLTRIAKKILASVESENVNVSSNCDFDFLTWEKTKEKIRVLAQVADNLRRII